MSSGEKKSSPLPDSAIEQILDAIIVTNTDGRIVFINKATEELFGYSRQELLGKDPGIFNAEPEAEKIQESIFRTVVDGKAWVGTVRNRRKDGSLFLNELHIAPVHDESGRIVSYMAIHRDVTKLKATEEALRKSEDTAIALLNASSDAALLLDRDGKIIILNNVAVTRFGRPAEELIGRNVLDLYEPEVAERRRIWGQELLKTRQPVHGVDERGGRWYDNTLYPILDHRGEVVRFAVHSRDVTDQRLADQALRASEERYRSLVEDSLHGIVVIQDYQVVFANPGVEQILDYSIEELMAMTPEQIRDIVHPEDREHAWSRYSRRLEGETDSPNPIRMIRKDGSISYVESNSSLIQFDGRPAIQALMLDVSKRAQLEEQLYQSRKLEAVGRLAGGVAHDFNNLLTVIKGFGKGLLKKLDDETHRKDIEQILQASEQAGILIQQLLAFSRKQLLDLKPFEINELVGRVEQMLRSVIGDKIALETELAEDLRPVFADPDEIERVLVNLVTNARDAVSRRGIITIRTRNVDLDDSDLERLGEEVCRDCVCLSVSDTGMGIDPGILPYLFEPFFSTKRGKKGSGLGLSVVYGIVKQHCGAIHVESEPGEGTTMRVYLPAATDESQDTDSVETAAAISHGKGERVLVVEDEAVIREMAVRELTSAGYRALEASNAEKALELLRARGEAVDLLFCDVVLPGMSGIQLVMEVQKTHPGMSVLLTTGFVLEESDRSTIEEKQLPVLHKPYDASDLLRRVGEILAAKAS